jgi:gluconolactonase
MYPTPPTIQARVFATLPNQFTHIDADNEWVRGQPNAKPHPVLEGPVFDAQGNLWCTDIPGGRIYRISPAGQWELVVTYDGWPNGLKFHRDGRLFIADYKHGIMVMEPGSREVKPFLVRAGIERFRGVNDLTFASNGDLYFTDQGLTGLQDPSGRVFRVTPTGQITCLIDNVPSPNGLVLNLEDNVLYVAATRANAVWQMPLTADGRTTKVGLFIQMSGGGGPDGMAMNEDGGLAVAHVGMGCVWIFDRRGRPVQCIDTPQGVLSTNIAYGGPDRRALFITEGISATILAADVPVAGRLLFSQTS